MKRVHVLAEGQTEETFLRDVLAQHLLNFDVYLTPIIVSTKRVKSGMKFKGGVTSYRRLKRELQLLLGDRGAETVTTMIDYYGLPDDFPGVDTRPVTASCYKRVAHLEEALMADLRNPRFLPYLSLHEFEALLLTSPAEVDAPFPEQVADRLAAMVESTDSPEEIDDGPETHPAARILRLLPTYRKPLHGPIIASRIGLEKIRQGCPHFDGWVTRLEEIGRPPAARSH